MKSRIVLFLMLFLIAMPIQGVSASPVMPPGVTHNRGVWTVVPHNSSPDDPQRIQAAVDMAAPGETVRLAAGTFDFSEFESVRIAKDLTLEGAWDSRHQVPLTTILHGYSPVMIGRKTPVVKPEMENVDGHDVYHITKDVWGKLIYRFMYPDVTNYNIFDDWTPVHVNVRQIAFERPYMSAIFTGAMNGGAIERVRIHSAWLAQLDYEGGGAAATGIAWFNDSMMPMGVAEWGRTYHPELYRNTDLIRGSVVVQDSFIDGNMTYFQGGGLDGDGDRDEAGDLVAVPLASHPTPPGGDYEKYVLQDVANEWDATGFPIVDSIQIYWVKKGYTAYSYNGLVTVARGVWAGVYSFGTQLNMKLKNNVIQDCEFSIFLLENGFTGVPFNAVIEGNRITPEANAGWGSGLTNLGWEHFIPASGELFKANPGSFITARNNTFKIRNESLWLDPAVANSMVSKMVMEGNRLDLASGSGVYLGYPAQATVLLNNRITGTGNYAMWTDTDSNDNLLLANDLRAFTPSGLGATWLGAPPAQVLLLSDNNKVVGGPHAWDEVVWDFGANNTVIGMIHQIGTWPPAAQRSAAPQSAAPQRNEPKGMFPKR